MKTPGKLDHLITSIGHDARGRPDLTGFGYRHSNEGYADIEKYRLFDPLSQRGWLLHFDAEGDYFNKGEHSKLVKALLTIAGLESLPEVRDTFISHEGWILEILDDERPLAYMSEYDLDLPSDYAETPLVTALVNDFLEGHHRVVSLNTGDQSAALCVFPLEVYDELVSREWLKTSRKWDAHPEALLTDQLGGRLPRGVKKLAPEDAQVRVSEAPDDWFADY